MTRPPRPSATRPLRPQRGITRALGVTLVLAHTAPEAGAQEVTLDGGATVVGQMISDPRVRDEVVSSLDLFTRISMGGLAVFAYVEGSTTPFGGGVSRLVGEANTDAGTALDGRRRGRVQLSELRIMWPFASMRAHVGLLDATGLLDVSRIANDENLFFLGVPFVNNPAIAFRDYALGAALEGDLPGPAPLKIGAVATSSHGLADNPGVSYAQLLDLGDDGKGLFAGATLRWVTPGPTASIGAWVSTAEHTYLDGSPGTRSNRGLFVGAGWSNGAHSVSGRAGIADPAVSKARGFVGLTYVVASGERAMGLAVAQSLASASLPALEDVTHGEAFLRRRLAGRIFVTVSAQQIGNSGFDPSGTIVAPRVWVGGLRLSAVF